MKIIIILFISTIVTFVIYKMVGNKLPDFSWEDVDLAALFMGVAGALWALIFLYNAFLQKNIILFSTQLLIWIGILLVIIIGYAFRFELNYVSQRVIAVLVPSYSWVNTHGEIVTHRNSDGHFYIDAFVNGVKIRFMVDTGASDVALTTKDAKKLNFDLSAMKFTKTYSTANGVSKAAYVELDNIKLGDSNFRKVGAHVGMGGLDISLLGMSVLERFKSFRIERDTLILSY